MARYDRILLKLSGEAMAGPQSFGIDPDRVKGLAAEIAALAQQGIEVGVVVGGGNIFRGIALAAKSMDRVTGDHMGMLATVINSLALQDALEQMGQHTRVMSAIQMHQVAEPYIRRRAIRHLEKGPHRDLRRRHLEPLLLDRHRGHPRPSKSKLRSSPKPPRWTASTTKTR